MLSLKQHIAEVIMNTESNSTKYREIINLLINRIFNIISSTQKLQLISVLDSNSIQLATDLFEEKKQLIKKA